MAATENNRPTAGQRRTVEPGRPARSPARFEPGPPVSGRTRVKAARAASSRPEDIAASTPPLRIQDPGELAASLPALIGFHPRESLVMIATGGQSGRRIGLTLRVDLPPPEHVDEVVDDAVGALLVDDPVGAAVIVVGGRSGGSAGPPHAGLAATAVAALERRGVAAHTVLWVQSTAANAPWACYDPCCCSGLLPDPASTAFAASVVASGQVIHGDRVDLVQMVTPADPDRVRRRERLLIHRLDEAVRAPEAAAADPTAGLATVDAAIAAAVRGALDLDDRAVVELAYALGDLSVRDAALLHNIGSQAAAAEQLWTALVREMPDPEAAEPAALLAVSALLRGDGALANVALERAERAWPGHRLARLLRAAADAGMRPAQVRAWLAGSDCTGEQQKRRPVTGRRITRRRQPR